MTALSVHLPFFAESGHPVFKDWEGLTGIDVTWQIGLIIFFVALNGFFVAAEFAIVKVRTSQIDELIEDKRSGKKLMEAKRIVSQLDSYLAATQLGITMASVALSMLGERYIERLVQPVFHHPVFHEYLPFLGDNWIPVVSFGIAFGFLTFLHVVFGELMPKSIAIRRALSTTLAVSKPLTLFEKIFRWAIRILNGTANYLLKRFFKLDAVGEHEFVHSAEELQLLVAESQRSKQVTPTERDISINALELNDRVARDVMTPRTEIAALDPREDFNANMKFALESKHTRFPLRERNLDNCLGVVHIKDFLRIINDPKPDLIKIKRDILIVPETQPLDECLKTFLARRAHMALVVDEFGATVGMVTLEDVLEELVGEIEDEFDSPGAGAAANGFERAGPDEFFVDGKLPLYELSEQSDLDLESDEVSTIGGYITSHLGHLPAAGEKTHIEGYDVTITSVDERKILRLHFKRTLSGAAQAAEERAAAEAS
jgi:CBS domain containing-hemolysin-like protein